MEPITGDWGVNWQYAVCHLADFAGNVINVRFRGYTGDGELSDMAIDDITITEMTIVDPIDPIKSKVAIFPNPSNGVFTITFEDESVNTINYQVYDLTGRMVISEELHLESTGKNSFEIDLSGLYKGVFYIVFKNENIISKEKIVIL
jgi:hypothetical protein